MSAALLIAALIAGKITLSALGVADWALLAQAGFTAARLAVVVGKKIEKDFPRGSPGGRDANAPPLLLCFQGAPSAQAARFCN